MTPIKFPGSNIVIGENQPQYIPLPALRLDDGQVYTCWELNNSEIEDLVSSRKLYIKSLTFKYLDENGVEHFTPFQPILPLVDLSDEISFL
jgi:hypothetical protein